MKIPERLVGFVKYKDTDFPFEFDKDSFILYLFPPTKQLWVDESDIVKLFESKYIMNKKHEWINFLQLDGISSDGNNIIFNISDNPSNYNGFLGYNVNWYFYYSKKLSLNSIGGLRVRGKEVNFFYPPEIAFTTEISSDEKNFKINSVTINENADKIKNCGRYRVSKNVSASIQVRSSPRVHFKSDKPLEANSQMDIIFSSNVNLDTILDTYYVIENFFVYTMYRKNIHINNIEIFNYDSEKRRDYNGILVYAPLNGKIEKEKENSKTNVINYNILQKKTAQIFALIKNKSLGFQHICESSEDTCSYTVSRFIMIFSEFEHQYKNIYGQDIKRSEKYKEVKSDIIECAKKYKNTIHGDKLKYAKDIIDFISFRDNSFL